MVPSTRLQPKEDDKAEGAGEAERARHSLAEMVLGLDETQKGSSLISPHASKPNWTALVQIGVESLPSILFERTLFGYTAFLLPCRKLPSLGHL